MTKKVTKNSFGMVSSWSPNTNENENTTYCSPERLGKLAKAAANRGPKPIPVWHSDCLRGLPGHDQEPPAPSDYDGLYGC